MSDLNTHDCSGHIHLMTLLTVHPREQIAHDRVLASMSFHETEEETEQAAQAAMNDGAAMAFARPHFESLN